MERAELFSRIRKLVLESGRLAEEMLSGGYRSVFKGRGIEFEEVREYSPGDDARLIDWNVSARMRGPYIKLFREQRELKLFLLFDNSLSMLWGAEGVSKRDQAAIVFSLLAYAAHLNDDCAGAAFFADSIQKWVPPRKGRKHALALLRDAAYLPPAGKGSNLELPLRAAARSLKKRSIIVLISDFLASGYFPDLGRLSEKHDMILCRISSPLDRELPDHGLFDLQDPETGDHVPAPLAQSAFRKAYELRYENERREWESMARRGGASVMDISVLEDPARALMSFFSGRGK